MLFASRIRPLVSLIAACSTGTLAAHGCSDDSPAAVAPPRVEAVRIPTTPVDPGANAATPTSAGPLIQANAAASGKAKAAGQLGFDLAALSRMYSVEGTPLQGPWGIAGTGELGAMRDDDVGTAWRCAQSAAQHCVAGLAFTEPVTVHSVRLSAAAGPKWQDYRAHPRPKKIRVHTDAGWFDTTLDDGSAMHYVNLTPAVTTQTLAVEVLEIYAGKKNSELWFGELEAFASTGPVRAPLVLDPSRVVIAFETEAWKAEGASHTIRIAYAQELGAEPGTSRRLMRATAIHGRADDRFLVIERRFGTDCTTDRGSYLLLDRNTRVLFPLGDKGEVPAQVTLRGDGQGALFVRSDDPDHGKALVFEHDQLVRHQPKAKTGETTKQLAARLAFTANPVTRGGSEPGAAPAGCSLGTTDEALVQRIGTALDLPGLRGATASICTIDGNSRAVVGTDGAACGPRWYAAVVGPAGEIVAQNLAGEGDSDGAHFAPMPGLGVVLEGTRGAGATSDLWLLDAKGIRLIVKGGALAVREPKACRPCASAIPVLPATGELQLPDAPPADTPPAQDGPVEPVDAPTDAPAADTTRDKPPALPGVGDEPQ